VTYTNQQGARNARAGGRVKGQMASRRRQPRGPQGERASERTRARAFDRLATSNRARRRDEKITDCHCSVTYLVAGPRGRIVIKPTRQASPIGRVYRRPSRSWWVVVSGAPCREPGGPRRGAARRCSRYLVRAISSPRLQSVANAPVLDRRGRISAATSSLCLFVIVKY